MIRDKDKVYGEVNHEDTVLADNILSDNKYVVGTSINKVDTKNLGAKRILHSDQSNKLKATTYNAPTKYIGTDASNNLVLYNRIIIPTTVPPRRELVIELKGSENAADTIAQRNILLTAPYFYEVEVLGADGGGGAGILLRSGYGDGYAKYYGSHGGVGGYYKAIHLVREPVNAILQPGNAGEGAKGFIVSGSGKSRKITGSREGGAGGNSIELFERVMSFDIEGQNGGGAGLGFNGGANGGSVQKVKWDGVTKAAGGGGGGANGPYGGEGGSIWAEPNYDIPTATPGGAGGAGGGFGEAGRGGGVGGDLGTWAYSGGGSGGTGYFLGLIGPGDTEVPPASSGGGGGGGGGSRLVIGEEEILTGGGGGGAGGTHNYSDITMNSSNGANGSNNKNTQTNPTKYTGGAGGTGLDEDSNATGNTAGGNGDPGVIRIWRCIP